LRCFSSNHTSTVADELNHCIAALSLSSHQRFLAIGTDGILVGVRVQQKPDDIRMTVSRSHLYWSFPLVIAVIHIGPGCEQHRNGFGVATL
jgi:hypothetical protein